MRDSVEFLRSKAKEYAGEYNPEPSKIFKAAAKEIARLRRRLTEARLTDAEREAIREAAGAYFDNDDDEECAKIAAALHGLLKRTDAR
jgi:hypothetical protein